ncbi:MAG: hypothetical protein PHP28_08855 [Actinomycetota bacterium]|nr:hypothetical protein [Actinomycetota bacterium]MDD5667837.1 hypothetical protein [Actinomycetota bacterium]
MEEVQGALDPRDELLSSIAGKVVTAVIVASGDGILSGAAAAAAKAEEIGLGLERILDEGSEIAEGDEVARFTGTPIQVAKAEEDLIGLMAKTSGIATAARDFVKAAGKKPRVVCCAWKKMPPGDREAVRQAVASGGMDHRLSERPFLYLDENIIEMFGGIRESIAAVSGPAAERIFAVQLRGKRASVSKEAIEAAECGAGIVCVDTGVPLDFMEAAFELERAGLRKKVKIAFGGDLGLKDLRNIKKDKFGIEIVDVGKKVVDAPLLDMRMEVIAVADGRDG